MIECDNVSYGRRFQNQLLARVFDSAQKLPKKFDKFEVAMQCWLGLVIHFVGLYSFRCPVESVYTAKTILKMAMLRTMYVSLCLCNS